MSTLSIQRWENTSIWFPIWPPIYEDAFGYGLLFSISKPTYYEFEGFFYLVDAAGMDVPAVQLLKLTDSLEEVERRIKNTNEYQIGE